MEYEIGQKLTVMRKSCCGKAIFDHNATLIEEVKADDELPIWAVRLENGEEVNRHLYPPHEIEAATGAAA